MSCRRRPGVFAAVVVLVITLTGCSTAGQGTAEPLSPFADGRDAGSSTDRRAVREAAVGALSDENQAFVIDSRLRGNAPAAVLASVMAPRSVRERAALLGRARTSTLARELESSFSFSAHQEFGPEWTGSGGRSAWLDRDVWASSSFHVDSWQGVRVSESTARVLVRGEHRGTAWGGTAKRDAWAVYELVLHRDPSAPHGWRVVHEQAASTAV